ncbi:CPBP family intramembrane glutamic endopeptidase [Chryseobacterium lathyri]|jgi:membrane protease YdiL (CAAX protease family)|uniref:CAAX amino protease n=1 Tax=Chryseobacterium lathyri TaxID=395933 RepID=A0A511Y960_9FLAO|nr:type II CAAX endopeptidase family protein [Chryseobacterium lathyri]GEN71730.1 CAAX amino protease [Chryseobacterium lathyri]
MSLYGKYALGILFTFVLLAAVMLYALPLIYLITGIKGITSVNFFYTRIVLWMVLFFVFLYNFFVEKNPFLLQKEKNYTVSFYTKSVIRLYFTCLIGTSVIGIIIQLLTQEGMSSKMVQISSAFKNNYLLMIFICLTAGVVEELLMRGYIQPRIERIYNNQYCGIFISALLFGILHSTYGTIGQVVVPFFIGTVFAMFYKQYSNIKILIICHFMYDFVSVMIMNLIDTKHLSVL